MLSDHLFLNLYKVRVPDEGVFGERKVGASHFKVENLMQRFLVQEEVERQEKLIERVGKLVKRRKLRSENRITVDDGGDATFAQVADEIDNRLSYNDLLKNGDSTYV